MADFSFDVVSKVDLNIVEEAINIAKKEVSNRYDFKDANPTLELLSEENKLKLSRRIATVWVVISMAVAIFIGIIGYSMSKVGAIDVLEGASEAETLIIKVAMLLSEHGVLAIIMAGLILLVL